jgi:hypothetical protein
MLAIAVVTYNKCNKKVTIMTTIHPKTGLWTTSETSDVSNMRSTIDDIQYNSGKCQLLLLAAEFQ